MGADPLKPHPFELCVAPHMWPREPHCNWCDRSEDDELHAEVETTKVTNAA